MRKSLILFEIAVFLVLSQGAAFGFWIWSPDTSNFTNPKKITKQTPQEQFTWAFSFYEAKDYARAAQEMKNLVRRFPQGKEAAEAQFYVGRAEEALENYEAAFKAYEEVVKKYPNSVRIQEVIEREYHIANLFYSGKKRKIAGLEVFPAYQKAIEIYKQVVAQAPYGPYAELSQYKIGECHKKAGEYKEAREAFEKLIDEYPTSALRDDAKYQIALTTFRMTRKPSYDEEATNRAIEEFSEFIREHPESELVEESEEAIRELQERKAEKAFEIAEFYVRQGSPPAAKVYYNKVIEEHADSPWAEQALEKLMILEKREQKR